MGRFASDGEMALMDFYGLVRVRIAYEGYLWVMFVYE